MSRRASGKDRQEIRIPLSQAVVAGIDLHRQLRDPTIAVDPTRVIARDEELPVADESLTGMGEMVVSADGGGLRTFSGKLAHENGWWPSLKRGRLLHWEGMAQRNAIASAECDFTVNWVQPEARRFHFHLGRTRDYTCDLEVDRFDAPTEIWEIKRDDRALEDPDYRLTLAGVDEICRRIGLVFRIVMADEIFADHRHRNNVELFASRRFVTIGPDHLRRFEAFAARHGPETTYGELANVIDPACPARGAAVIQGLTVRRRVEVNLRELLTNRTPVRIH